MLFKRLKKLNLFLCLIVCFSLVSNVVFAGSDLDRALSSDVEPINEKDDYDYDYYKNYYENVNKNDDTNSNNTDSSYKFVENFTDAVHNEDISEIKYYLQKGEDEIVKNFRAYHNKYEDLKHPKTMAYFFIAKGNFIIGRREAAYKYYSNAISFLNNIQNPDQELKASLFRERAFCVFTMRNSNAYEDINVKKSFDDLNKALNINANDWVTYYYAGIINTALGDKSGANITQLEQAKSLCDDINQKKEIQKTIEEIRKNEPGFIDGVIDFVSDEKNWDFLINCFKFGWNLGAALDND